MAVIGHSIRRTILMLALTMASGLQVRADDSAEIRATVGDVARALSSGDAAQAITGFSKSYPDYDKLRGYFEGLTGPYAVECQVDFTDEEIVEAKASVTLRWVMTLTTRQTQFTTNRNAEITSKLVREGKRWRIVEFGPIVIFDPQGG